MTALFIALGGALGAVLRSVTDGEIKLRSRRTWPIATLCINVVGSFVLGLVAALNTSATVTAFVVQGVCGGFTTFSTASVEAISLVRERRGVTALAYVLASVLVCVSAVLVGMALGRALV